MIGINKRSAHIEASWEFVKELYTSREIAEATFRNISIIYPVKALWDEAFYDEPDPFFGGQAIGRMFIEQAPYIPLRPSSPYTKAALARISTSAIALRHYAESNNIYDVEVLTPVAFRLLQKEEAELKRLMSRNVFSDK